VDWYEWGAIGLLVPLSGNGVIELNLADFGQSETSPGRKLKPTPRNNVISMMVRLCEMK
jgi:hypothetical protein